MSNFVYQTWEDVREIRNYRLDLCDWTQLEDSPLTEEQKNAWKSYRQSLRDLPETFESPELVVFPEEPGV